MRATPTKPQEAADTREVESDTVRLTKGERTAARIMDAAEPIFAKRGFEATSLREIARAAGIQQPGLYNHFESKRDLYAAVLNRALSPMTEAMTAAIESATAADGGASSGVDAFKSLPSVITDLLLDHPAMASLFQQALQDGEAPGLPLIRAWLDRLLNQGVETARSQVDHPVDRATLALEILAMFNVTTGYFLAQRALDTLGVGDLKDPANIARQKEIQQRVSNALTRRKRS